MHGGIARAFSCRPAWRRAGPPPSFTAQPPRATHTFTVALRSYFVRFQSTPNEACYKFYVDNVNFLPDGTHTMMFDRENDHQSPIARTILHALPMVEEVTIGRNFLTVKRVEEANAEAAARYFAMRFHGTAVGTGASLAEEDTAQEAAAAAAVAERSQSLLRRTGDAMKEDSDGGGKGLERKSANGAAVNTTRSPRASAGSAVVPSSVQPFFQPDGPDVFEMGGFAVSQASAADEALDEAAIAQLIEAMDWSELKLHVSALLTDHLHSGEPHVSPEAPHPHEDTLPEPGDSEVVLMIKELLSSTVRPQLQGDGGDIRFVRFDPDSGAMEVELLGACRTCRSSKTTLVDLIERTTRHWIPEVSTVLEVGRRASAFEQFTAARRANDAGSAGGVDVEAARAGSGSSQRGLDEEDDDHDNDPTKTAGHGAAHRRVVVDRATATKVLREVHSGAGDATGAAK